MEVHLPRGTRAIRTTYPGLSTDTEVILTPGLHELKIVSVKRDFKLKGKTAEGYGSIIEFAEFAQWANAVSLAGFSR